MKVVDEPHFVTYREIVTQPDAWQEAIQVVGQMGDRLRALWQDGDYAHVVFTGCGSTYYLALAAAALWQELTGRPARGVPAGELVMYPHVNYAAGRTLLVAISRSAETSETVQAVSNFRREREGEVVVVTNYGDRPLCRDGDLNLVVAAGQEESVAQTRSFASMYVAITAMAALLAERDDLLSAMERLPEVGQRMLSRYEDAARSLGQDLSLDRFYFLGSGPRYGLASEVSLKMKEMTLTHSEPFHFLEFRHGPKAMVGESSMVVGLLSEANRAPEEQVLADMRQLGGRTLALGEDGADISFASYLPEEVRNVLYLPVLQLMAYYRSVRKGLNPDRPHNLDAVVRLEL